MDDIIVIENDMTNKLRYQLSKEFELIELGKLRYFLVMEIIRSKSGIFVS